MMGGWLTDHLIRTGHLTETGVGRGAKIRTCDRCQARVLAGLDADRCAFEVHADPVPLSALGEALAQLEGRRTVALHRAGGRWELDTRDSHDIAARPAGATPREDVLRVHRCGDPDPPAPLIADSRFPETQTTTTTGDTPPF